MSIQEIAAKAKELRELKMLAEELTAEITTIEDQIKSEMAAQGTEIIIAGEYRIAISVHINLTLPCNRFWFTLLYIII